MYKKSENKYVNILIHNIEFRKLLTTGHITNDWLLELMNKTFLKMLNKLDYCLHIKQLDEYMCLTLW